MRDARMKDKGGWWGKKGVDVLCFSLLFIYLLAALLSPYRYTSEQNAQ